MIKPPKVVIAGAAVAGLLAGSMAVRTYAASASTKRVLHSKPWQTMKSQGGCKSGDITVPIAIPLLGLLSSSIFVPKSVVLFVDQLAKC